MHIIETKKYYSNDGLVVEEIVNVYGEPSSMHPVLKGFGEMLPGTDYTYRTMVQIHGYPSDIPVPIVNVQTIEEAFAAIPDLLKEVEERLKKEMNKPSNNLKLAGDL